jgi:alkylation response protein AidB-like acyl-CoA dehydrogenase
MSGTNGNGADLKTLKGVSERDREMIAESETLLGVQPDELGCVKSAFWGRIRDDLLFPYPPYDAAEKARCDELLDRLRSYLEQEHPSTKIDQGQEIPRWVIDRLFELGVLGMTIPAEFGGGGFGITSYNRALEAIGRHCGSTAVLVSAHQSIGCKAVMLFGTDEQKAKWLPHLAKDWLSAFCLSEPNVGCDAGGQETRITKREDGSYVVNGEKKWSTSGAISGLFTVMGKQQMPDGKDRVTAVVVTPDMPGIDIFQKNRSKCGIRGTWQARIRFKDVVVPAENLLHKEGKGLNVALTCLNYGRCTLSAGMLGGARRAAEQAYKWAAHRRQFNRSLSVFELVREKLARMSAYTYAMDALLYATTGFLDRHDDDIQLETAACKVFCSEIGWRTVNDAMQIMGGEGYMTENEVERIFRDSRINTIVEGANEVMQSYIFAYGGRALAEHMLGVKNALGWDGDEGLGSNVRRMVRNGTKGAFIRAGVPLAAQVYLGLRAPVPHKPEVHDELAPWADKLALSVRQLSHEFKLAAKREDSAIVGRQVVQARLADAAIWIHAWACTLAKIDRQVCRQKSDEAMQRPKQEKDRAAAEHFMALAEQEIKQRFEALYHNADATLDRAAQAALDWSAGRPDSDYVLPERAEATGRMPGQDGIPQFPGINDAVADAARRDDAGELNRTHDPEGHVADGQPALAGA